MLLTLILRTEKEQQRRKKDTVSKNGSGTCCSHIKQIYHRSFRPLRNSDCNYDCKRFRSISSRAPAPICLQFSVISSETCTSPCPRELIKLISADGELLRDGIPVAIPCIANRETHI